MASLRLQVFCAGLRRGDYEQVRTLYQIEPGLVDIAAFDTAIKESVNERLRFAEQLLEFAEQIHSANAIANEVVARNVVSRSYYTIHHTLRAVLLYEERTDPYGHVESIEAFANLLERQKGLKAKMGSADKKQITKQINNILRLRHLADYHFLGTDDADFAPVDFVAVAGGIVNSARFLLEKVNEYLQQREAGIV